MLQKSKGDDLADAFRDRIGMFAIGIIIIAAASQLAGVFIPDATDLAEADKKVFGSFLSDLIVEGQFYLQWAIYFAVIAGGIMIGISLRIRRKPSTHDRES